MSRGAHTALHSLVVRVFTDNGIIGVGGAHQGIPGYSSETVDTMHAVVSQFLCAGSTGLLFGLDGAAVYRS